MLHPLEAAAVSADASTPAANQQHEPHLHRLAFSAEISPGSVAAFKEHFSSMEGELGKSIFASQLVTT